jgi:hypothetical protein
VLDIPEGWQLVPIEPTSVMLSAVHDGPLGAAGEEMDVRTRAWLVEMYKAYLEAAPRSST